MTPSVDSWAAVKPEIVETIPAACLLTLDVLVANNHSSQFRILTPLAEIRDFVRQRVRFWRSPNELQSLDSVPSDLAAVLRAAVSEDVQALGKRAKKIRGALAALDDVAALGDVAALWNAIAGYFDGHAAADGQLRILCAAPAVRRFEGYAARRLCLIDFGAADGVYREGEVKNWSRDIATAWKLQDSRVRSRIRDLGAESGRERSDVKRDAIQRSLFLALSYADNPQRFREVRRPRRAVATAGSTPRVPTGDIVRVKPGEELRHYPERFFIWIARQSIKAAEADLLEKGYPQPGTLELREEEAEEWVRDALEHRQGVEDLGDVLNSDERLQQLRTVASPQQRKILEAMSEQLASGQKANWAEVARNLNLSDEQVRVQMARLRGKG